MGRGGQRRSPCEGYACSWSVCDEREASPRSHCEPTIASSTSYQHNAGFEQRSAAAAQEVGAAFGPRAALDAFVSSSSSIPYVFALTVQLCRANESVHAS